MSDRPTDGRDPLYVLGSSRRVLLREVDDALGELWRTTGEEAVMHGHDGVARVRECNLLAYAVDEAAAQHVSDVVPRLAQRHPARVIVLLDEGAAESEAPRQAEAWVTAACHLHPEGGRSVCWEQLTLPAGGRDVERLPVMATPFLVADLPVVLWWPDRPGSRVSIMRDLGELSDKVVLDSAGFVSPWEGLRMMAELLGDPERDYALADLGWSRLTPWREMVAGLFDDAERRALLPRVTAVRVAYGEEDARAPARSLAAVRALLLVSWLSSRLGWRLAGTGWEACPGGARLRLGCPATSASVAGAMMDTEVVAELVSGVMPSCPKGGLHQMALEIEGGERAGGLVLAVERLPDGCLCAARVGGAAAGAVRRTMELVTEPDDVLLSLEIDYPGADEVYEESLRVAASLAALPGVELIPLALDAAPEEDVAVRDGAQD